MPVKHAAVDASPPPGREGPRLGLAHEFTEPGVQGPFWQSPSPALRKRCLLILFCFNSRSLGQCYRT